MTSTATLQTRDGPMDAFVREPDGSGKGPGVVLLQEIFGVSHHFQELCRRFAAEGFVAAAPELFHRQGKGIVYGNDEGAKGMAQLARMTNEGLAMDVQAALDFLRAHPRCDGRVGVVGFCAGGFATFLAACRTDGDAFVAFYGGGLVHDRPGLALRAPLAEAAHIRRPILCLFGGKDPSIPPSDVAAVRAALSGLPVRSEVHVYPEAGHAFFNDERPNYEAEAARDAWPRTLRFLRAALAG